MKLTDASVRALSPSAAQADYYDDSLSGFHIRVGTRAKTFRLIIGSGANRRRHTIGRYDPPHFTLSMARERAKDLIAEHRLSPEAAKAPTFEEAFKTFCATHETKNRASTRRVHSRLVNRHWQPLFKTPIDKVTTGQIVGILDTLIDTPIECNSAFAVIRTIFNWAVKRRLIDRSPVQGLDKPAPESPRSRVLTPDELRAVWETLDAGEAISPRFTAFLKLLILTGQRKGQLETLRADQIDRQKQTIFWPGAEMKGRRDHTLPYGPLAASILDTLPRIGELFGPITYTGHNMRAFRKACSIFHFVAHDFRRTWATISAEEIGTEPHIIEAVLAHQSGTVVSRTYNRARYIEPMRKAVVDFENWLLSLLAQQPASIAR